MALHPRFELLGIDYGPNLELARRRFPHLTWTEHDLDRPGPLPLTPGHLEGSVVICAHVIEQLVNPELLLGNLRALLPSVEAIILATPQRDAICEAANAGPPAHAYRVREWNISELAELLAFCQFDHGDLASRARRRRGGGRRHDPRGPATDVERAARIDTAVSSAAESATPAAVSPLGAIASRRSRLGATKHRLRGFSAWEPQVPFLGHGGLQPER